MSDPDISQMKVADLRRECKARGLASDGKKSALQKRLGEACANSGSKRTAEAEAEAEGASGAGVDGTAKRKRTEPKDQQPLLWQVSDAASVGQIDENFCEPERIKFPDIAKSNRSIDFLIETVNDTEFNTARSYLDEWDGKRPSWTSVQGPVTVYYGLIRGTDVKAAVVQTSQGSRGQTGAATITGILVGLLKPRAVLLVGVCFGTPAIVLDNKVNRKLRMGDVLVGSQLLQYDHSAERDGDRDLRAEPYCLPEALSKALKECATSWNQDNSCRRIDDSAAAKEMMGTYNIQEGAAQAYVGPLLCGSKLIDNRRFHEDLIKRAVDKGVHPLGGEMEGYGAYEGQTWFHELPCIVIKAICDWGITKSKTFQSVAADAAFNFLVDNAAKLRDNIPNRMKQVPGKAAYDPLDDPLDLDSGHDNMLQAARAHRDAVRELGEIKASQEYTAAHAKVEEQEKQLKLAKTARDKLLENAKVTEKTTQKTFDEALTSDITTNLFTFDRHELKREFKSKAPSFTRTFALKYMHPDAVEEMVRAYITENRAVKYTLKERPHVETQLDETGTDE